MDSLKLLVEYLPFIIPLAIAELVLLVVALVHILRHQTYRFGNRVLWIVLVCVISLLGPVAYFIFGRGEE